MGLHTDGVLPCVLVLACALFCLATCQPCLLNSMQQSVANDACGPCVDDHSVGFEDSVAVDTGFELAAGGSMPQISTESICTNPHLLCFPSTLTGSSVGEKMFKTVPVGVSNARPDCSLPAESTQDSRWKNRTWPSGMGVFRLLNGQTVSCSLNSREGPAKSVDFREDFEQSVEKQHEVFGQDHASFSRCPRHADKQTGIRPKKNSGMNESPPVDVHPPVLDWGEKHIYSVSLAFLTVANTCNKRILTVYEPYSSNTQFYPCNFNEFSLGPGEVASLCFVFTPTSLGFTSGQLMLQTSSGGFFIEVKGLAVESPYNISPLVSSLVSHNGRASRQLSFFNPYTEKLRVKEVSAWMLASRGKISHQTEATCWLDNSKDPDRNSPLDDLGDWLIVGNSEADYPLMAMRPQGNWEVDAHHTETIMEIDFSYGSRGQMLGAFCIHLLRPSLNMPDTIIVPIEVDTHTDLDDTNTHLVSVSLEMLLPCDASNSTLAAISIKNRAPYMLRVVEITDVAAISILQIKYIGGLLLFPGSATQVAVIACNQLLSELFNSQPKTANTKEDCKLVVLTNDSSSPPAELPCQDIMDICWGHLEDSSVHYCSFGTSESDNKSSTSERSGAQLSSSIKAWGAAEADELILESWKSQGSSSMSVLDTHEISLPKVQVGANVSRWISVKNPSEQPVVMQLILNSGEIIDVCSADDGFVQPSETGNGFSVAEGAVTEAYVHPHGIASLGPIVFHPKWHCRCRSSALVRNNLSGVEWLSLTGFGGSFNLVLFEGSEPIQSIEFGLDLPLNISPPSTLFHSQKSALSCSRPLSKEIYAKNTGNMPLEVERIEVSGARCGSDGFSVHACEGFSLQPGDSKQLLITYQTDFSAPTAHTELLLALPSGLVAVPMKASLPLYMLNLCWKSLLWARLRKYAGVFLLAALCILLIIFCVSPQVMDIGYQELSHNKDNTSPGTVHDTGKTSHLPRDKRSSKLSASPHLDSLLTSPGREKLSKDGKYPRTRAPAQERIVVRHETPSHGNPKWFVPSAEQTASVPSLLPNCSAAESPGTLAVPQPCNLTVRIGKEKGRRRRKRRGLNGSLSVFEVSSSHSGNSTPSSPLSPLASTTPSSSWSPSPDMDHSEASSPFGRAVEPKATLQKLNASANHHKDENRSASVGFISASGNCNGKPVLLPSAAFPGTSRLSPNPVYTSLASASTIAPHARAPGSKLINQKPVSVEDKVEDSYRYDIWGDHFSGLNLTGSSNYDPAMKPAATTSDSNSFFVRGPQALMRKTQPKYVSCFLPED